MRRRGVTLIELLIVVFITLLITATAIPLLAPRQDERAVRETTRILTSALAAARSQAIARGKPFGVTLQRFEGRPEMCVSLTMAESQQPYSGDTDTSGAMVGWTTGADGAWGQAGIDDNQDGLVDNLWDFGRGDDVAIGGAITFIGSSAGPDSGWRSHVVKRWDRVQIDAQGQRWIIDPGENFNDANGDGIIQSSEVTPDENGNNNYDAMVDLDGHIDPQSPLKPSGELQVTWKLRNPNNGFPASIPAGFYKYQIFRQPEPASGQPTNLPDLVAIDLQFSGQGFFAGPFDEFAPVAFAPTAPVTIMFAPDGSIDSIYRTEIYYGSPVMTGRRPISPVHLLVGRREFIPTNPDPKAGEPTWNWQDLNARWVTIQPVTGLLATTEVATYAGESYTDSNGNNQHDSGEPYADANGNGSWDAALDLTNSGHYKEAVTQSRKTAREGKAIDGK